MASKYIFKCDRPLVGTFNKENCETSRRFVDSSSAQCPGLRWVVVIIITECWADGMLLSSYPAGTAPTQQGGGVAL